MDELGNETFDTSGALDKLRKVSHFSLCSVKVTVLWHDYCMMKTLRSCFSILIEANKSYGMDLLLLEAQVQVVS